MVFIRAIGSGPSLKLRLASGLMMTRPTPFANSIWPACLIPLLFLAAACSGTSEGPEVVTVDDVSSGGGVEGPDVSVVSSPDNPNFRVPSGVADVEQVLLAFGNCVAERVPGVGMAIRFSPETGRTGEIHVDAISEADLDNADAAQLMCDRETSFNDSVIAFADANPIPREVAVENVQSVIACVNLNSPSAAELIGQQAPSSIDEIDLIEISQSEDTSAIVHVNRCVGELRGDWYTFGDDDSIREFVENR